MKWWIGGLGVATVVASIGSAKPPADLPVQGQERTQVERDLYLPARVALAEEPPASRRAEPGEPTATFLHELRAAVVRWVVGPLGTVPLTPPVMW